MNDDGKELGGVVFKNGAKIAERQPDWLGRCTIEGQAYSVALWEKESQRTGVPFMSMSFREETPPEMSGEDRKWRGTEAIFNDLQSVIDRVRVVKEQQAPQLAKAWEALVDASFELELVCSPEYTNNPVLF